MNRTEAFSIQSSDARKNENINNLVISAYKNSMIKDLIESCKNGDHRAQLQIYKLYYKVMFNISLEIVRDYSVAEDIMQESFLLAFEKIHSFTGRASFIKWLIKLVQDMSVDFWRKQNIPLPDLCSGK